MDDDPFNFCSYIHLSRWVSSLLAIVGLALLGCRFESRRGCLFILLVNVCFRYRGLGVVLDLPISFFGIDLLENDTNDGVLVSFSLFSLEGKFTGLC